MKKKHSEETQTLRTGCRKAESKKFAPLQTPFPGVRDCQNLISCRWTLPLPTNPVWQGSMHAISSYRGNRPRNTHTNPRTGPITIHCTAASLTRSVIMLCHVCLMRATDLDRSVSRIWSQVTLNLCTLVPWMTCSY